LQFADLYPEKKLVVKLHLIQGGPVLSCHVDFVGGFVIGNAIKEIIPGIGGCSLYQVGQIHFAHHFT
jgi:hypothetical protein